LPNNYANTHRHTLIIHKHGSLYFISNVYHFVSSFCPVKKHTTRAIQPMRCAPADFFVIPISAFRYIDHADLQIPLIALLSVNQLKPVLESFVS
jgi:hypothetical protein